MSATQTQGRISRIPRIRNLRVFRDFAWPSDLHEFGRYNLIYGWNGSGKSTISRLFRLIETGTNAPQGQVVMTIDGYDTAGEAFSQCSVPVRVFNKDFVAETVFTTQGDVAPIFVLGKHNVEDQKTLERLKAQLVQDQQSLASLRQSKRNAEDAFESFCTAQARVIRDMLSLSGSAYNNYNKADFKQAAQRLAGSQDLLSYRVDATTKERLLHQHQATPKGRLGLVAYTFPDLPTLYASVSELLAKTVVSCAIEVLKNDPDLAAWVHDGLAKHKERHATTCLFCGLHIPQERMRHLEAHFNEQYETFLKRIDAYIEEVKSLGELAAAVLPPIKAELYESLQSDYDAALVGFNHELTKTKAALVRLADALASKKRAPFDCRLLSEQTPLPDGETIRRLNAVLDKHNKASDEFTTGVAAARERLETAHVVDALEEYARLAAVAEEAKENLKAVAAGIKQLEDQIAHLERSIVDHREPAEELNKDLHAYLGHNEISLEVKNTGYQLSRNGQLADGLSEGERTAVALLYFLKTLVDRRFNLQEGIVVLDDPVSSLDANALFSAFGFIRDRTVIAGQVFILTHNFAFFRQVRNWFHHLAEKQKVAARMYMLDCRIEGQERRSAIRRLDPLLEQYQSDYHYLFACVYRAAQEPPTQDMGRYYLMPNVARRLLEAFLAFRRPDVRGRISAFWKRLQGLSCSEIDKTRIERFLNTYSHHDEIGDHEHDPSILGETPAVLRTILAVIKAEDPQHYAAMEALLGATQTT